MEDVLPYIFSLLKFSIKYRSVCRFWDKMYIKAVGLYPIEVKLVKNITNNKFMNIYMITNAYSLNISNSEKLTNISSCDKLKILNASFCNYIGKIIDSIRRTSIIELNLTNSIKIGILPLLDKFTSLRKLNISGYSYFSMLPNNYKTIQELHISSYIVTSFHFHEFINLKTLYMSCRNIKEISDCNRLEELHLINCKKITKLPNFINLRKLYIFGSEKITKLPNFINLTTLKVIFCGTNINILPDNIFNGIIKKLYFQSIDFTICNLEDLWGKLP